MIFKTDVVVIGAGAAGIAAARYFSTTDLSVLLLEASSRLGGRARTETVAGRPLDIGCGWLHSANRNVLGNLAEVRGYTLDRQAPAWGRQYEDLGATPAVQSEARAALTAWHERLTDAMLRTDCAADALPSQSRWHPYLRAFCGFANGVSPEQMSATDYLTYDTASTGVNWRVREGYGALIASSLPDNTVVRLATPVLSIRDDKRDIVVRTQVGDVHARAVILTVSTAVLSGNDIALPRGLDPWKNAASNLPLGRDEKFFLQIVGDAPFMPETHMLGSFYDSRSCAFYIRPFGWPIIECYFGGDSAYIAEQEGLSAGFSLAIEQLVALMGSNIRSKLRPLIASNWRGLSYIRGAYSCALPGHAAARHLLAQPYDNRIFFAGEATRHDDFATAHGAYQSGRRAACEVLDALGVKPPS